MIRRFNRLIYHLYRQPEVIGMDKTLETLLKRKASIARFGDGEFDIIFGHDQGFQIHNKRLACRLKEVLKANDQSDDFLVGIPDCYGDLSHFTDEAQKHWSIRLDRKRLKWYRILNRKQPYYQAQISRFYMDWADKSHSKEWAEKLKNLWEGRDLLIVEGFKSRMGIGNDLFDKCKSVRRILCPAINAFNKYNEILSSTIENAHKDDLILIALGPTASVLAYDLYNSGFQAIDIGHIDIEYEWMKLNVREKVRVHGKFVNEISGGNMVDDSGIDDKYYGQIIAEIK